MTASELEATLARIEADAITGKGPGGTLAGQSNRAVPGGTRGLFPVARLGDRCRVGAVVPAGLSERDYLKKGGGILRCGPASAVAGRSWPDGFDVATIRGAERNGEGCFRRSIDVASLRQRPGGNGPFHRSIVGRSVRGVQVSRSAH